MFVWLLGVLHRSNIYCHIIRAGTDLWQYAIMELMSISFVFLQNLCCLLLVCFLEFYVLATYMVIWGRIPTCDSAHYHGFSAALLGDQAALISHSITVSRHLPYCNNAKHQATKWLVSMLCVIGFTRSGRLHSTDSATASGTYIAIILKMLRRCCTMYIGCNLSSLKLNKTKLRSFCFLYFNVRSNHSRLYWNKLRA